MTLILKHKTMENQLEQSGMVKIILERKINSNDEWQEIDVELCSLTAWALKPDFEYKEGYITQREYEKSINYNSPFEIFLEDGQLRMRVRNTGAYEARGVIQAMLQYITARQMVLKGDSLQAPNEQKILSDLVRMGHKMVNRLSDTNTVKG